MHKGLQYQIDEYYLYLQKQGQGMELISEDETLRNPFPGLRPFRTSEAHLFFGREGQSEELIERLMRTRFLAVLGNSGSGKSSLVRAGLIPALHAGRKQRQVSDWKIVICRPGNSPLQNLAAALAGAKLNDTKPEVVEPEVRRFLPILQDSSFGLLEAEAEVDIHGKTLLIVDQFEELFRFGKEIPPGDAAHFVDLLLNAVGQEGAHIYVVITMRSEFLGECVRYRGLPEIINSGQYLVPRLTGENVRRAVTGPLAVVHAPMDAAFANRLVREVGDNMDQLPLLQHALRRSYQFWQQSGGAGAIGHVHFDTIGGMQSALGQHADEQYQGLSPKGQLIAQLIFQRLTELESGNKGGRRPTLMAEIYGLCGAVQASKAEVDGVIERFRQVETSFLMPPSGVPLQDNYILDISHESLIRNWSRLNNWALSEAENARLYQRLEQAREEENPPPPIVLQRLLEWQNSGHANGYWAARYHADTAYPPEWHKHLERFEQNIGYLNACVEANNKAALAEKAAKRQKEKLRILVTVASVMVALFCIGLTGFAFQQYRAAVYQRTLANRNAEAANKARDIAAIQKIVADSARQVADSSARNAIIQQSIATQKAMEAEASLRIAQKAESRALAALDQVKQEKAATEEQRRKAEENYRIAQEKTKEAEASANQARQALEDKLGGLKVVVRRALEEAERLVYQLKHDEAYALIRDVQSLDVSKQEVSSALLEFAFWYAETGELPRAWNILDTAYQLVGRQVVATGIKDLKSLRMALHTLDAERDAFLQTRYFPTMVSIKGGEFIMGSYDGDKSEKPPHRVRISDFQMAETEVTWWQYGLYATARKGEVKMPSAPGWGISGDNPVVNVSWYSAIEYTNWLNWWIGKDDYYAVNKDEKDPDNKNKFDNLKWTVTPSPGNGGYRLPTEAEWEYAAAGGKQQKYAGTDEEGVLGDYAWYRENSDGRTRAVQRKKANPFGLYDMSGNVWEWCWDWYGDYEAWGQTGPVGPSGGGNRVLRGGSWFNYSRLCRVSDRNFDNPSDENRSYGFRVVRQF